MQNAPRLGLHHGIPVWQLFFAQDRECVVNQESRRVKHNQDFSQQRFNHGLARFLRDAPGNIGLMREKNLLEAAQHLNTIANAQRIPIGLCGPRASHSRAHFGWDRRCPVHPELRPLPDSPRQCERQRVRRSVAHMRRSVRGTECPRQSSSVFANCSCGADTLIRVLAAISPCRGRECPRH